jgi:hypothetical protein
MKFDFEKLLRDPDGIRLVLSPRPDRTTHLQFMVAGKNVDHTCGPGELRELLSGLIAALGGNKIMAEFDFEAYAEQRREEAREIDRQLAELQSRKRRLAAELRIVESACAKLGGLENKPKYKRTPPPRCWANSHREDCRLPEAFEARGVCGRDCRRAGLQSARGGYRPRKDGQGWDGHARSGRI